MLDRPFFKVLTVYFGSACRVWLSFIPVSQKLGGYRPDMTIAVYWDVRQLKKSFGL